MKKFAFIESNTTGTGKLFVAKAIEKGYEVLFLTDNALRYPFLAELMVVPIIIDTSHAKTVLSYLKTIDSLEAIFSSSEYFIETASYVATHLGLPGNNVNAVRDCRDKWVLSQTLRRADIATPVSHLITALSEAEKGLPHLHFPVVLKPASGSGSVGVKRCDTEDDYRQHMQQLLSHSANERGSPLAPRVLVQEYIGGSEYSVEVLSVNQDHQVLGMTQKYLGPEPYFVEIGHDFPAKLAEDKEQQIKDTVIKAMSAMGLTLGAAHVELRLYNERVYIIEINPRLAGGMIPALMQEALNIDILDLVLDLHGGKSIQVNPQPLHYASIRFLIPPHAGVLKEIKQVANVSMMRGVKEVVINKKVGEKTTCFGDYRDRIGFVIASGDDMESSRNNVTAAFNHIQMLVETERVTNVSETGRLSKSLHPEALAIVNRPLSEAALHQELDLLTAIDEAHLLMLSQQKIAPLKKVRQVLAEIRSMKESHYAIFKHREALRGIYLLYESILIEKLGMEVGGIIHMGRSRNDINATLFKLSSRVLYQTVYQSLWKLRLTILQQAECHLNVRMPIYSQFQPALPGSYAFYLLAIEKALARDQESLQQAYALLAASSLGAGAGCGTSFPIDQQLTAKWLGFESVATNALDAIASRDLGLRLLSTLSIVGTTLSRIAQDYQLWTMQELAFFSLPDELTGGSSMMPQKKNPYLLEKIKGKALIPTGQLMTSLATMQKTPFTNSVEVGTEALTDFAKSFNAITEVCTLLQLIIEKALPSIENMSRSAENGLTAALSVTEILVKSGMPFREAHYKVGDTISVALRNKVNPLEAIYRLIPHSYDTDWTDTFHYGGGCAAPVVRKQLDEALLTLQQDGTWMQIKIAFWNESTILRKLAMDNLLFQLDEINDHE
jgi:argininosuccinate lyase